jgi:antitoxin component HigA of HigAB toxin-antitoxin module
MLRPIENEKEYDAALKRVEALKQQQLEPGSAEEEELEMLLELITLYKKHCAIIFMDEHEIAYVNELYLDFGVPLAG